MKKFKNLKILKMDVFCDGKEVDMKGEYPKEGGEVAVKLTFSYSFGEIPEEVMESVGKSRLSESDKFDFTTGYNIARARAIENAVISVNKMIKVAVRSIVEMLDCIEEEHSSCIEVLRDCDSYLRKYGVQSKVIVNGGDIHLSEKSL